MSRVREPIDCGRVRERLDDWLDDEVERAERDRIERHLRECPGCRAEAERASALVTALRALPQRDAPPRVRAAAVEAASRRRWRLELPSLERQLAPLPLAVASLVLLLALVGSARLLLPRLDGAGMPAPAEVAQATEDARQALRILGRIGERTARELREEQLERRVLAPLVRGMGKASQLSEPAFEKGSPIEDSSSTADRTEEP